MREDMTVVPPYEPGNMFESEEEFLRIIDEHDQLIQRCAAGALSFQDFLEIYGSFYGYYALHGDESGDDERAMFKRFEERIRPHEELLGIFTKLCSEEDALKEIYIKAGRFGSDEGLRRLQIISQRYFDSGNQL